MSKTKLDHLHTFERDKSRKISQQTGKVLYRCTNPDCWFYASANRIIGKRAKCPYCGESYVVTKADLTLKKPHCINCTSGKKGIAKAEELTALEQELKALL